MTTFVETMLDPFQDRLKDARATMSGGQIRAAHLNLAARGLIASIADTCVGVFSSFASIFKTGVAWGAAMHLVTNSSRDIFAYPFTQVLLAVNDNAKFPNGVGIDNRKPLILKSGNGLFTGIVSRYLSAKARKAQNSSNLLLKHGVSRLTYGLLIPACIISRAVDVAIGALAAIAALLSRGKYDTINNVAYRGLQAAGIIGDLCFSITKMVNPLAGCSVNS